MVQRTSSDLRLNPHLHLVVLDGAWYEDGGELAWEGLSHLGTSEVGEVLERLVRRIEATEVAPRSPGRGLPYWKSRVLRRQALGDEDDGQGRWAQETA